MKFVELVDIKELLALRERSGLGLAMCKQYVELMGGLEATRHIKATKASAHTRIVAVTAHALEEERREILAEGCDDFIRKPYHDVEIFDALTKKGYAPAIPRLRLHWRLRRRTCNSAGPCG